MAHRDYLGQKLQAIQSSPRNISYLRPTSGQLKQLLKARRARESLFGAHLFADPAWDILLLAYVALLDEERLLVSALCQASPVPATVTLRWARILEGDGWLIPSNGGLDDPGSWVELSPAGKVGMECYLSAIWPSVAL